MEHKRYVFGLIVVVLLSGCLNPPATTTTTVKTTIPVNASGSSPEGVDAVVEANNQFAFELYSELNKNEEGNLFFSPYSISTALAMTYEGAREETAGEIQAVFHYPEDEIMKPNIAEVIRQLNEGSEDYELRTANALWAQKDFQFLEEYFDTVEEYYGGRVTNLDFIGETEESRQTINKWVEEQTNDKIKDLIPEGMLNQMTRLVLTNAIYFKGTWVYQFDEQDTRDMDFKINPYDTVKAQMMYLDNDEALFNYAETDELQMLELPYEGDEISMLVLLPKSKFEALENELNAAKLNEYRDMLTKQEVIIYMPKFTFETKYNLNNQLTEMGMPTAFSPNDADFSGMTGRRNLFIAFVIHQAYVDVNEEGTEAAAATGVGMELSAMPMNIFRADHPFIFIIQQKDTGNILFLGRVMNPAE